MNKLIEQLGLKPKGGNVFHNDDHRVSINGELWNCHKCGKGGAGSIALVMHVLDLGFIDAKKWLGDDVSIPMPASKPTTTPITPPSSDRKTLPVVIEYLTGKRGLNRVMIEWCVSKGIIYSDYKANACFRYGTGVAMRGTGSIGFRANRGVMTECFTVPAKGAIEVVAIVESAIDALSYRQLNPDGVTACAIAGNGNGVLMQSALDLAAKNGAMVVSAFDNDKAGNDGHDRLVKLNDGKLEVYRHIPDDSKDWNEYLLRLNEEENGLTA
jgi:hypothetical protein